MHKEILIVRALLAWVCSGHFVIDCEMRLSVQLASTLFLSLLSQRKLSASSVFLAMLCVCSKNAVLFY